MRRNVTVVGLFFVLILTASQAAARSVSPDTIPMTDLWLRADDFRAGQGEDVILGANGVTVAENVVAASYTSPELSAPIPFNALVPQWRASLPGDHGLEFHFRTASGADWGPWLDLHESPDMSRPEDDLITGDMLVVPAADVTHSRLQFRVDFTRQPGGQAPRLEALRLTFIDATAGPTAQELVEQQQALAQPGVAQEAEGYPKPPVVSRDLWCTDPACHYSDGLRYEPVTHLILHHTVTSSSGDSAATVRAIWKFHTFDRGWGDIGYNYLVDVNGVIFEGHLGGDDVVGTHAAGANAGSMALSLIGNFVDVTPPDPMMESAADLFAWKADQKDIDVYDAAYVPEVNWGLPKLMGHRDVYGTTQCPGDKAHALLPDLRDAVAQRIGFTPPHLYYDEKEARTNFTRTASGWNVGPRACGIDSNAYYAWSTTDPGDEIYWAEWRPQVDVPGRYQLSVYAPYCYTQARDTNGAVYRITDAGGSSTVTVNQEDNLGIWVPAGEYYFDGTSTSVRLTNLTSSDDGWGLWADALRLLYVDPGAVNQSPIAASWQASRTVTFQWSVANRSSLVQQTLQAATDPLFKEIALHQELGPSVTSHTYTFADDYPLLYWRLVLLNTRNETIHSHATSFGIDTEPPTSSAYGVLRFPDGSLLVVWSGEDAASGVVGYNIEYRAEGSSAWTPWQKGTQATNAIFTPPQPGTTYWFRSQAIDGANHVEAPHQGSGDSNTAEARLLDERVMFPLAR